MPKMNALSSPFVFERDEDMEILGGELYTADALYAVVTYEEAGSAVVKFEASLDNVQWFPYSMTPSDGSIHSSTPVTETNKSGAFHSDHVWHWTRFRVEGLAGENITVQYNLVVDQA